MTVCGDTACSAGQGWRPACFEAAQEWQERYDDCTGPTEDFEIVYEEVSGQDLDSFFDVWLRTPTRPTIG
jgi:aminopeptidase N